MTRMATRTRTLLAAIATTALGLAGCNGGAEPSRDAAAPAAEPEGSGPRAEEQAARKETLTVEQAPGNIVYWVLPGPRALSEDVFGTPENPQMRLAPKLEAARAAVEAGKMPPSVPQLIQDLPILVGVPMQARTLKNGQWVFAQPNPFGDDARIVQGSFSATFENAVDEDLPGPPGKTPDSARFESEFTDPAGNDYRLVLDHVLKPPFPGYRTEGGVMIDSTHHGATGTGSPLMPQVDTHAAFWGVGELYVNGELVQPAQVFHVMTTEVVRDRDYALVHEGDLPLPRSERHVRDQAHHTHLMVLPVTPVKGQGPTFEPVKTAFTLPNGQKQPFMHIMFEQDEIVSE